MRAWRPHPVLALAIGLWTGSAAAQPGPSPGDAGVLPALGEPPLGRSVRVGYSGSAPFVVSQSGSRPDGLSLSIWRRLAEELGVETRWQPFDSVRAVLEAVAAGQVDVGVGPISVTSRRSAHVDFSQPYFSARVGILSPHASSAWARLRPFFNRAFLLGVSTLVLVLMGVGTLMWALERRRNGEQFPAHPAAGIREGMWFALVTMTTVGYGDRVPTTGAGRVVAGVWMVFAMVAASSLTAGIASALTLSHIDTDGISSLSDLAGQPVAVVRGTPAQRVAARHGGRPVVVDTVQAGVEAVATGRAAAMLHDLPVLDSYVQTHPDLGLLAHASSELADDYAFAVPIGSDLRRPISRAVLRLRERRAITEIAQEWSVQD